MTAPKERRKQYNDDVRKAARAYPSAHHAAGIMFHLQNEFRKEEEKRLIGKGWNEVAWDFYGPLLQDLENHVFVGAECPVYAAGYDWRSSNEKSARRLNERIDEILSDEKTDQVVLITHSMGGLVARSFFKQFGESKVAAVIHITQPSYGAPVLYRRFKVGGIYLGKGNDGMMTLLLGNSVESTATRLGVVDGALELLPSSVYKMSSAKKKPFDEWISWSADLAAGNIFSQPPNDILALYREATGHLGVIPPGFAFANDFSRRLQRADDFQRTISGVFHRHTYWVCSLGHTTDVALRVEPLKYENVTRYHYVGGSIYSYTERRAVPYRGPSDSRAHDLEDLGIRVIHYFPDGESDGTVPYDSQRGHEMKPGPHPPADDPYEGARVEHDKACTDSNVVNKVKEWVQTVVPRYAAEH